MSGDLWIPAVPFSLLWGGFEKWNGTLAKIEWQGPQNRRNLTRPVHGCVCFVSHPKTKAKIWGVPLLFGHSEGAAAEAGLAPGGPRPEGYDAVLDLTP